MATIYSNATAATTFPAVTLRDVGSSGGQVAAFTYDLPRSVVQTRQGNPAWAGQERDGQTPIRSDDLFFGGSSTDWVNLSKVAIPQADEQQRLLANLIQVMNRDRKPLPRFWYFPRSLKAVVDRHRRRPRQRWHRRAVQPVPGEQPGGLLRRRVDLPPVLLLRLPEHAAVRLGRAGVHEPGLRGRRPRQHQLRELHGVLDRDDVQHPAGAVAGELPESEQPGHQPAALHRLERLVVPGQRRTGQRHAAGHELLLLARILGAEPSRLHDRLRACRCGSPTRTAP